MKTHETDLFSQLSFGLIYITKEGLITFFNKFASQITSLPAIDVLNKHYADFFTDRLFGFSITKALLGEENKKTIFLTLQNDTKEWPLEVTFSRIDESGIVIEMRDATEWRKMKQTLERNDRLKEIGEMAARLAHEIRNPLGGIEGFAELLCRDLKEDQKKSAMAQSIVEGTRLLNRLVTNVLHFAKPLEVNFKYESLNKAVEDMVAFANAENNGRCHCESEANFTVMMDKELVQMAFLNILRNAFEASPANGIVFVNIFEEMPFICISVRDEGGEIKLENLEKIFTPFFTTKSKGTGLGLSEAHKAITAHGGKIEVLPGVKGTTFVIKLKGEL